MRCREVVASKMMKFRSKENDYEKSDSSSSNKYVTNR